MPTAQEMAAAIRRELRPLEEKIAEHPYLSALEEARIPKERLRLFAGQQYQIIPSDLRSIGLLVNRYGSTPSGPFFLEALKGEAAALEALLAFAKALGMTEEELRALEPLLGAHAYTAFVAWLALYGSAAEFAAAFLVNLPAWGANCGRMSRALKEQYGLKEPDVALFDLFAGPATSFEGAALAVMEGGLARGVEPRLMQRAARLLQGYELMYWDTLYQASTP